MTFHNLSKSWGLILWTVLTPVWAAFGAGPAFDLVGPHPTSTLTRFRAIQCLTAFEGRIYTGYGDWNEYPPVVVTSFDPASRKFHLEHSIGSDSIGVMRVLGSTLWIPHMDPIHGEDFEELSAKINGVWREMSPFDSLHVFDCAQSSDGALFLAGAADAKAILGRSSDNGKTWTTLLSDSFSGRYYWCFVLNDRIYCQAGSMRVDGTGALVPSRLSGANVYKPTTVIPAGGGAARVLALADRLTGFAAGGPTTLLSFDGETVTSVMRTVRDFAVSGGYVYVLDNRPGIVKASLEEGGSLQFEDLEATGIPQAPTVCVWMTGISTWAQGMAGSWRPGWMGKR